MFKNFNDLTANFLGNVLASMWFFWSCLIVIDGIELIFQAPHTPKDICDYLSQTVIQLLSLSILAYISKNEGQKSENRHEKHFEKIEELEKKLLDSQQKQNQKLDKIAEKLWNNKDN